MMGANEMLTWFTIYMNGLRWGTPWVTYTPKTSATIVVHIEPEYQRWMKSVREVKMIFQAE